MNCPICLSEMSEPIAELFALPSVASDCRPWSKGRSVQVCSGCGVMKRVTNDEFDHDVYKNYTSYPEPTGRTKSILEFVAGKISTPESILDIGCGKGDGLQILQEFFPLTKVSGYEPTIHRERPSGKYDLITLFHVFEHVENLHEMIDYIRSSLTKNGHVLIQVPYAAMWPFDLVIADHVWHFSRESLMRLFGNAGFQVVHLGNDIIKKEITLLAYFANEVIIPPLLPRTFDSAVDWILNFKKILDENDASVAVYGTSVSAMWTAIVLGDKVDCYVDDDKNRLGTFNGKNVHSPYSVTIPIVAPFANWQLAEIKKKHPDIVFL